MNYGFSFSVDVKFFDQVFFEKCFNLFNPCNHITSDLFTSGIRSISNVKVYNYIDLRNFRHPLKET